MPNVRPIIYSESPKHNTDSGAKPGKYLELGRRLHAYREQHGLGLHALANQFNVTHETIRNWEDGRIPIRALPLIRKLLGEA